MALMMLVSQPDLTSIERLMSAWSSVMGMEKAPSDSTFSEARKKLQSGTMRTIWKKMTAHAVELVAPLDRLIEGLQFVAVDGSWVWAPHEAGIINRWGRPSAGKGKKLHFPQLLLVTALDVLTRVPLAAAVLPHNGSERAGMRSFIDIFKVGMVAMVDRGFPAGDLLWKLVAQKSDLLWRMGTADVNSWECVYQFLHDPAKPKESTVDVHLTAEQTGCGPQTIQVRLIRRSFFPGRPRKGQKRERMVLMTTLLNAKTWPAERLIAMYERRWVIEDWHRDIKVRFGLEAFHSRTDEGVEQEIDALMGWITLCAIVERNVYQRIERSRGAQHPEDPIRFQINRANLYFVVDQLFAKILANPDIRDALTDSEMNLRWLDSTARRRRPGRSYIRERKAPHGRWNG